MDKPKKRVPKGNMPGRSTKRSSVVDFGENTNAGDISTGNIAGRDITSITNTYYNQATNKRNNIDIDIETVFSQAIQALLRGDLWDANRLFELVKSVEPYYPRLAENLHKTKTALAANLRAEKPSRSFLQGNQRYIVDLRLREREDDDLFRLKSGNVIVGKPRGKSDILGELNSFLGKVSKDDPDIPSGTLFIVGAGGIGKTHLVHELAMPSLEAYGETLSKALFRERYDYSPHGIHYTNDPLLFNIHNKIVSSLSFPHSHLLFSEIPTFGQETLLMPKKNPDAAIDTRQRVNKEYGPKRARKSKGKRKKH